MTLPHTMPLPGAGYANDQGETARLRERLEEVERERDQLVAVVDILTGISASLHFEEILQTIARKLGEMYGLDRCSIYLAGEAREVRLMATYEDPRLRNLIVDLDRYPELRRAFDSGQTVFLPDAADDPLLAAVRDRLAARNVGSIIVAPIRWQRTTIGAIFLRTEREASPFTDRDVRFCQVIASLTANALRNAHRFESLRRARAEGADGADASLALAPGERERVAFLAFLRRLIAAHGAGTDQRVAEALLPEATVEELDRLAVMAVRMVAGERMRG
jgi:GAF domain-containing protein